MTCSTSQSRHVLVVFMASCSVIVKAPAFVEGTTLTGIDKKSRDDVPPGNRKQPVAQRRQNNGRGNYDSRRQQ